MPSSGLFAALGYRFVDEGLLLSALTHRSFGANNNERLEFLGDGVLNFAVAAGLFNRFPLLPEGDLSRLRAHLVRQDSLYQLALKVDLGIYLRLGDGELRSGGRQRPSILADALEAIFGAIFLEAGFDAARGVIDRLYDQMYDDLKPGHGLKDAKTRLQEWLQGRKKQLPRYVLLETSGAAHSQVFAVACELEQFRLRVVGEGTSRRIAEQSAAELALKELDA